MKEWLLSPRGMFAAVFLTCIGLLGFGMVLQHVMKLEPCPMCIMQRYALLLCGLIALVAAGIAPGTTGRRVAAALLALTALTGAGVAARQSWIQLYPPKVAECGADLEFMLDAFPLTQALPMIFRGSGDCTEKMWVFLGLSIANWSLLWFLVIAAVAMVLLLRRAAR